MMAGPAPNTDHLLESEDRSISDFIIPGILGLAGVAVLYSSFSKNKKDPKKDPKKKAHAPEAGDQEVRFDKNFIEYSVGKDWESAVLEPFLAERADGGDLLTLEDAQQSGFINAAGGDAVLLSNSRKKVLDAFRSTHSAIAGGNAISLSKLPSDKTGVQKFNEWLSYRTKNFQEEY